MNERKMKGLTNFNSDEKIIRDTCVSFARMYFSQFAAISCLLVEDAPAGFKELEAFFYILSSWLVGDGYICNCAETKLCH